MRDIGDSRLRAICSESRGVAVFCSKSEAVPMLELGGVVLLEGGQQVVRQRM